MRVKNRRDAYFYSSVKVIDNSQLKEEIRSIFELGYRNIIILFNDIDTLKSWLRDNPLKHFKFDNLDLTRHTIYRYHISHGEDTVDAKMIRRQLNRVTKLEERYKVAMIKSVDEAVSNLINPNIMEYYGVKLIRLDDFRWWVLKRFHQHKVYFEVILDRLFTDTKYRARAFSRLEPLEEMGRMVFTQSRPIVRPREIPHILSALTEKRHASYGPIVRWGDLIW